MTESRPRRGGVPDTPDELEELRARAFRSMPPHEKMRRVTEMNRAVEAMAAARIRAEHGDGLSERELELRLAVLRLGPELFRAASGLDPDDWS